MRFTGLFALLLGLGVTMAQAQQAPPTTKFLDTQGRVTGFAVQHEHQTRLLDAQQRVIGYVEQHGHELRYYDAQHRPTGAAVPLPR